MTVYQYLIFAAVVSCVVLPTLFHFEYKAQRKSYEFDEHVADAIRLTLPN